MECKFEDENTSKKAVVYKSEDQVASAIVFNLNEKQSYKVASRVEYKNSILNFEKIYDDKANLDPDSHLKALMVADYLKLVDLEANEVPTFIHRLKEARVYIDEENDEFFIFELFDHSEKTLAKVILGSNGMIDCK